MNNNASMFNRLVAVFLDLIALLGFTVGAGLFIYNMTEINILKELNLDSRNDLIWLLLGFFGLYFILEIFFTKILSSTPGKLCMNCDVDFHAGNTFIHCFIRAFIKVLCVMTVLPGIFSYVRGSGHYENKTYHDSAANTNVTNTTRTPRFIGLLIFFAGLVMLVYFIYKFHSKLNLNFTLWDTPEYKIFDLGS